MASSNALKEYKSFIEELEDEVNELRQEALQEFVCSTPQLHSEETLDILLHNKLKLECEIESLFQSKMTFLPQNDDILLKLANEDAQNTVNKTSQTLEYQNKINQNLKKDLKKMTKLIQNAEAVDSKLDDLIQNRKEEDYVASLKNRYSSYGELFVELRDAFNWYLKSRFPSDGTSMSMEEVLERVTSQFLNNPSEPYVDIGEEMKEEHLNALIRANLITRHPQDSTKVRLLDFRRY